MRHILKPFAILLVKILQKRYKYLSTSDKYWAERPLASLELIQAILYYFKQQFSAWGYFHPDCAWTEADEVFYNKLFPVKDFKEVDIVIWNNPEAVIFYHNEIHRLNPRSANNLEGKIRRQLIEWDKWR